MRNGHVLPSVCAFVLPPSACLKSLLDQMWLFAARLACFERSRAKAAATLAVSVARLCLTQRCACAMACRACRLSTLRSPAPTGLPAAATRTCPLLSRLASSPLHTLSSFARHPLAGLSTDIEACPRAMILCSHGIQFGTR